MSPAEIRDALSEILDNEPGAITAGMWLLSPYKQGLLSRLVRESEDEL